MPTLKVINMTARSSSGLSYNDFLYLTKEAPLTDEKMQASVLRDFILSGIKTSSNSGLAQTSSAYAAANPEYELSVDANNLATVTAVTSDYIIIQDITDNSTKKALISDVVSTGDIEGVTAGTNLNGGGTSGTVTLNLDTTITGLTSVTSTDFVGALTGNADTATTAATVTGGTQAAITTAANLVTVGTIGTGVWQGTDIAAGYIADTVVTPGSYTLASITVDQQGRLTSASSGSGAGGDVVGPASSINNSVARFDTLTGKLIQDTGSNFVITDVGAVTAGSWTGAAIDGAYIDLEGTEVKSTGETGGTKYLKENGSGGAAWAVVSGAGIGDVSGPGSSTDDALATFDGVGGKTIQNSSATLSAGGTLTATAFAGPLTGNVTGTASLATALASTLAVGGGGTGVTTIAKGSVLVANAADTLSVSSGVTDGHVLTYTSSSDTVGWAAPAAAGDPAGSAVAMAIALGG